MENNKDINPDNSAISEQDSGVESISNIDTDFVEEVSNENATSPFALSLIHI